jgi:hypothetical protein
MEKVYVLYDCQNLECVNAFKSFAKAVKALKEIPDLEISVDEPLLWATGYRDGNRIYHIESVELL